MKKYIKLITIILLIALSILALRFFGLLDLITDISKLQNLINSFGIWSYLVFILLYTLAAVFLLPGSALTIASGIIFGPIIGGLLASIAATIGATCSFIISRYLARDLINSKLQSNKLLAKIDKGVQENGTSFLILTRLVPIFPYNIQNYAYGLTKISFTVYIIVSFFTMLPGGFIYAYLAGNIIKEGISFTLLIQFTGAGIILFLISLIPKQIAKKRKINLKD